MMKVQIISYYRWWNQRHKFFYDFFKSKNCEINYVVSDYDHIKKEYINEEGIPNDSTIVHVPKYKSNISFKRIVSNIIFSIKVKKYIYKTTPDIVVILIPSNLLGNVIKKIRKKFKNIVVVVDLLDMWPESLPISNSKKKLLFIPFLIWKKYREKAIKYSDYVIYECEYFRKKCNLLENKKSKVLYLHKSNLDDYCEKKMGDKIIFLYLGSINNIIDINLMISILSRINRYRTVELRIIGKGCNEDYFVNLAKQNEIPTIFYGAVFDEKIKISIMRECHFGLNLFKNDLLIGLTTKSIDYFYNMLPIINNIKEDTEYFVKKYNAGINYVNMEQLCDSLISLSQDEYNKMTHGVFELYRNNFSQKCFDDELEVIFNKELGVDYD